MPVLQYKNNSRRQTDDQCRREDILASGQEELGDIVGRTAVQHSRQYAHSQKESGNLEHIPVERKHPDHQRHHGEQQQHENKDMTHGEGRLGV